MLIAILVRRTVLGQPKDKLASLATRDYHRLIRTSVPNALLVKDSMTTGPQKCGAETDELARRHQPSLTRVGCSHTS